MFTFEDWEDSKWPNLVILEFAINCPPEWKCPEQLDVLIHILKQKWLQRDMEPPAFMFLELFTVGWLLEPFAGSDTVSGRISHLNNFDRAFNRAGTLAPYIEALGKFYGFPVLSNIDVSWPAFTRHFVQSELSDMWPYTVDGTHLSDKGHKFVTEFILVPFLTRQMSSSLPSFDDHLPTMYDHDLRMFPDDKYRLKVLSKWTSWGYGRNSLQGIAVSTPDHAWAFTHVRHHEHGHNCFGSTASDHEATAVLSFESPKECGEALATHSHDSSAAAGGDGVAPDNDSSKGDGGGGIDGRRTLAASTGVGTQRPSTKANAVTVQRMRDEQMNSYDPSATDDTSCSLKLVYVHSWNRSYVGNLRCALYSLSSSQFESGSSSHVKVKVTEKLVNGNFFGGRPVRDTTVKPVVVTAALGAGPHVLECAKVDARFSCIAGLAIERDKKRTSVTGFE